MNQKKKPLYRPFISVFFRCCQTYQRIYRHRDGDRYEGRCPHCLRPMEVPIRKGGADQRFFEAE